MMIILKTCSEIQKVKESSSLVAEFLGLVKNLIAPGIKLCDIEVLANEFIKNKRVLPAFKGYEGYPFSVCASVNNIVVHGFPIDYELKDGDTVGIDFGVLKEGYYGDAARTYKVGKVSDIAEKLLRVTEECLYKGIEQAIDGNTIGDISKAIQTHAEENGFTTSKSLIGHGIGRDLHEGPPVPNVVDISRYIPLKEGMTIAIEPIVFEGKSDVRLINEWEEVTADGKLSAHFEHTIAVRKDKAEILSLKE